MTRHIREALRLAIPNDQPTRPRQSRQGQTMKEQQMNYEVKEKDDLTYALEAAQEFLEAIDIEAAAIHHARVNLAEAHANPAAALAALKSAAKAGYWGQRRLVLGERCGLLVSNIWLSGAVK